MIKTIKTTYEAQQQRCKNKSWELRGFGGWCQPFVWFRFGQNAWNYLNTSLPCSRNNRMALVSKHGVVDDCLAQRTSISLLNLVMGGMETTSMLFLAPYHPLWRVKQCYVMLASLIIWYGPHPWYSLWMFIGNLDDMPQEWISKRHFFKRDWTTCWKIW